ncbi:GIY-YIG nuclease family protein [Paenibacillus alvei]|uniref:GIY-YIG nuclease family protein n=1 Tax=Paenibacillus alvei TaxID=44250 RepID=A0AAP7DKN3_PAEAL|nr:GIY-YIG nuclease family protein [Paenibacillus alvei]NOJ74078.1 GIY-YIG nuclease family protein [Paenibacillus alvei]
MPRKRWYNDQITERYIYALLHFSSKASHVYIGQSVDPYKRFISHENPWVNEQVVKGEEPKLLILEKARLSQYEAYQLEVVWLRVALSQNFEVHNSKADIKNAWSIWDQLKPLVGSRKLPNSYELGNFQMIEDENLLNHILASWIRLIGEH